MIYIILTYNSSAGMMFVIVDFKLSRYAFYSYSKIENTMYEACPRKIGGYSLYQELKTIVNNKYLDSSGLIPTKTLTDIIADVKFLDSLVDSLKLVSALVKI